MVRKHAPASHGEISDSKQHGLRAQANFHDQARFSSPFFWNKLEIFADKLWFIGFSTHR